VWLFGVSPGVPRCPQVSPGVPRCPQVSPGVPRCPQVSPTLWCPAKSWGINYFSYGVVTNAASLLTSLTVSFTIEGLTATKELDSEWYSDCDTIFLSWLRRHLHLGSWGLYFRSFLVVLFKKVAKNQFVSVAKNSPSQSRQDVMRSTKSSPGKRFGDSPGSRFSSPVCGPWKGPWKGPRRPRAPRMGS